uniref:Endonuclease/exonuclease/phosphatase domain-containing protein n=1 Tax=Brassica oleracea TaxID=3712 RepID=A0A3P6ET14_BRAOL|nr:unnamed protein product [Brassica oleracea]
MVEGPSDGPLRIREREDGETARNQADQFQISRINKDNNTDVIPQTEGALANKSNETPERRKDQEEDDASMEDGEFNKMVDYYNELGMAEEMIDEDDMLDDIVVPDTQMMAVESENEQIEAIAQLRQKVISKDHTSNTRQNKDPPDQKQMTPRSRDTKGIAASRKLAAKGHMSPKSKGMKNSRPPMSGRQAAKQVPHSGVFPSALKSRKPVSLSSSVMSQKPPNFMLEFGYDHLFTVDPVGRSGGLALFYMDASDVIVNFSNNRMIDIEAHMEGHKVFMTFVYGDLMIKYRENVWERLIRISSNRTGVWLLMGDFNEITSNLEKKGGKKRPDSSFLPFKNRLAGCGMIEFQFMGNSFSWA